MGFETGEFEDTRRGICHVEAKQNVIVVWNHNEMEQYMRMTPNEARKLCAALQLAVSMYDEDEDQAIDQLGGR